MKRKIIWFFINFMQKIGFIDMRRYNLLKEEWQYMVDLTFKEDDENLELKEDLRWQASVVEDLKKDQEALSGVVDLLTEEINNRLLELAKADKRVEVLTNTLIEKKKFDKKR